MLLSRLLFVWKLCVSSVYSDNVLFIISVSIRCSMCVLVENVWFSMLGRFCDVGRVMVMLFIVVICIMLNMFLSVMYVVSFRNMNIMIDLRLLLLMCISVLLL